MYLVTSDSNSSKIKLKKIFRMSIFTIKIIFTTFLLILWLYIYFMNKCNDHKFACSFFIHFTSIYGNFTGSNNINVHNNFE